MFDRVRTGWVRLGAAQLAVVVGLWWAIAASAQESDEESSPGDGPNLEWSFEAKSHYRDSDDNRFPLTIAALPPELANQELSTVDPGSHLELSAVTLELDATWGESLSGKVKVDFIDLYDRNPTSTDREIDVDEAWLLFGRETETAIVPERGGGYLRVGKFPKFERQDDRHLESYGLVSTAFNRFEDMGLEVGADLGRHVYVKASLTQGNPVFMRDSNALAGDNGLEDQLLGVRDPEVGSGFVFPYDAEVEDLDVDGDLETGAALGFRFGPVGGPDGLELMAWGYRRDLAETVQLEGTLYGGDLDLLRGPANLFEFPITTSEKEEFGANLWWYYRGLTVFAQYVDQDLAGLERTGIEAEVAWRFDLPVRWAVGGRQLFPFIAPAVRFSRLDPDFLPPPGGPTPSFSWDWDKLDVGVRLGIVRGIDLTAEYADNDLTLLSGAELENDEMLVTLRWRS